MEFSRALIITSIAYIFFVDVPTIYVFVPFIFIGLYIQAKYKRKVYTSLLDTGYTLDENNLYDSKIYRNSLLALVMILAGFAGTLKLVTLLGKSIRAEDFAVNNIFEVIFSVAILLRGLYWFEKWESIIRSRWSDKPLLLLMWKGDEDTIPIPKVPEKEGVPKNSQH